jgi:hypothetical protein
VTPNGPEAAERRGRCQSNTNESQFSSCAAITNLVMISKRLIYEETADTSGDERTLA